MGTFYLSTVLWCAAGELPPIFEGIGEDDLPVLGEAVQVDEGGFEVRPPVNWEVRKSDGKVSFLAPAAGRFRDSLVVKRYHRARADDFIEVLKQELGKVYEPLRIASEATFEGAGLRGRTLTVDYTEVKAGAILDLRSRYYLIDLGASMIVAVGTSRRERFEKTEGLLDDSVKSLKIFGPGYQLYKDGTCSFPSEGYAFRLRTDMSLEHRQYDEAIEVKISSPGRSVVLLRISRPDPSGSLRTRARALASRVPGAEISRFEETPYECWRILASKGKSAIYQFVLGQDKDRFLVSATAATDASEVARDVVEHVVKTFKLLGG